jgi:hypothetical protein
MSVETNAANIKWSIARNVQKSVTGVQRNAGECQEWRLNNARFSIFVSYADLVIVRRFHLRITTTRRSIFLFHAMG